MRYVKHLNSKEELINLTLLNENKFEKCDCWHTNCISSSCSLVQIHARVDKKFLKVVLKVTEPPMSLYKVLNKVNLVLHGTSEGFKMFFFSNVTVSGSLTALL